MSDYVVLGTAPTKVELPSPGKANYSTIARAMCGLYIALLEKKFGKPPEGAYLAIKKDVADGTFHVALYWTSALRSNAEYHDRLLAGLPETWTDDNTSRQSQSPTG